MSALTERVAREHQSYSGIECACGHYPDHDEPLNAARTRHLIEVTEAATRAAVAAEIDALADRMEAEEVNAAYLIGLSDAARISEGKQP